MRSVTEIKSLRDVRTGITAHARSRPKQKGSTYLEVYLLGRERQRLETEVTLLAKRKRRVEERLGELRQAMDRLLSQGQGETPPDEERASPGGPSHQWKRMAVEY